MSRARHEAGHDDVALGGVTVLELADEKVGFCGKILADLGAEVIRVEAVLGDASRRGEPHPAGIDSRGDDPQSLFFNANKRGLTLDPASRDGQRTLRSLLARSDVLLEGSVPGSLEGLGLAYQQLREVHSGLVMASVTAFGQTGPYRHYHATDLVCSAMGGMMYLARPAETSPLALPGEQTYLIAALHAATGILMALRERETSGLGQHIDISIQEVQALQQYNLVRYSLASELGWPAAEAGAGPHGAIRCRDGFVNINVRGSRMWQSFFDWVAQPPQFEGAKWANRHYRGRHSAELNAFFEEFARTKDKQQLFEAGQDQAHLLVAPMNDLGDFAQSPQAGARRAFVEVEHPRLGRYRYPGPPQRLSQTPRRLRSPGANVEQDQQAALATSSPVTLGAPRQGSRRLPLAGIRVADFTWAIAGPYCTRLLGEFGAEVIKIESSAKWQERGLRPGQDRPSALLQRTTFADNNRDKLDITVNLGTAEGRRLALDLVRVADVVVENFSPRVMERWGLGYRALRSARPDIIVCSLSGFGQDGPYREYTGAVSVLMAASGMNHLWRESSEAAFLTANHLHGDYAAGVYAGVAVLAALRYRQRTGRGQYIDQSQAEVMVNLLGPAYVEYFANGRMPQPRGNHRPSYAPHNCFRCLGHERWCVIAVTSDEEWRGLCRAMGDPVWSNEARFADVAGRLAHEEELDRHVEEWTSHHTPHQVMRLLQAAGVSAGAVQNGEDLYRDPHLRARGFLVPVNDLDVGEVEYPGLSIHLSETPGRFEPCARMGEHNGYVFGDLLGLSAERVTALTKQGVLV